MAANEGQFIARWVDLRARIEREVVDGGGRLVKSLGDGMLAEFADVRSAVTATFAILDLAQSANARASDGLTIALRIGLEVGEFLFDRHDVYGNSANLAARLCGLGQPNEIIISANVRNRLTDAVDADIDDLGACFLKHVEGPIQAYRIRPPGSAIEPAARVRSEELLPTVAIIPLRDRDPQGQNVALGDVIADELIHALSRSQHLGVISRLSTSVFRWRRFDLAEIAHHLKAKYVLSGAYAVRSGRLSADIALSETASGRVVLERRMTVRVGDLFAGDFQAFDDIIAAITSTIMARELARVRRQAMPTLESYSLLLGAIALMHRLTSDDFLYARQVLEALIQRVPRESAPQAWLAAWYTIKVQQGLSDDPHADGLRANELALRAVNLDPESSLGLSICGLVHTNFLMKFDLAEQYLDDAIAANPNDALAILHKSALYQFTDRGKSGYGLNLHARALSPRDPHRYYYEAIAASCAFSAGEYELALEHVREALRSNRSYASAARVKAASLWQLGRHLEAKRAVSELLTLEPNLTVDRWLKRSPAAAFDVGKTFSRALRKAGVPG